MPPVVNGESSGTTALPSSGLMIGAASDVGHLLQFVAGAQGPLSGQNDDLLAGVEQLRRRS